ncbi:MAG: UdgX family uracil-DNA binding protein [Pseudolabrys sp.]|nr:UdgX family uracil-DNA binding protein [Pseudolabrys sp.]
MIRLRMKDETSLEEFRDHVRGLIAAKIKPRDVTWSGPGDADLFGDAPPPDVKVPKFTVPGAYVDLARSVLCHRDPERFAHLYELLWRLLNEDRMLLAIFTDPLVYKLKQMEKAIRRDRHKMTAFVRFRSVEDNDGERFVAWFEPQHLILNNVSSFFVKRFANMRWTILTPDGTLDWDRSKLTFGPGVPKSQAPSEDALEEWWLSYYRSTFNPARVNPTMMRSEMPVRYWKNLPEAALIPGMLAQAEERAKAMIQAMPTAPRKATGFTLPPSTATAGSLAALKEQAQTCQRCPLFCNATQTVFGEGPDNSPVVFVGEQPGDQEDLAGQPFVGPAGQVFNKAALEAGIDRDRAYVTNAVKHFKFEPRGKRRIHKRPNNNEVEHCRWWLDRELNLIKPKLVVALGGTAARALTGKDVKITELRGKTIDYRGGPSILFTVHPSYLLRLPDEQSKRTEYAKFVHDLSQVTKLLPLAGKAA